MIFKVGDHVVLKGLVNNIIGEIVSIYNDAWCDVKIRSDIEREAIIKWHTHRLEPYKGIAFNTEITKVIFNDPATIVFWNDGTKTVVKCRKGDKFDHEKGLAMAISKKAFGNLGDYYNKIKKWLPEEKSLNTILEEIMAKDNQDCKEHPNYKYYDLSKSCKVVDLLNEIMGNDLAKTCKETNAQFNYFKYPKVTCRQYIEKFYPERVNENALGGIVGCPYKIIPSFIIKDNEFCDYDDDCVRCFDRKIQYGAVDFEGNDVYTRYYSGKCMGSDS